MYSSKGQLISKANFKVFIWTKKNNQNIFGLLPYNLFTTSESPKYSNPPIFCCLQNFVFFLIKSRAKYWNHAIYSNSDSMGVQLKALKYSHRIIKKKSKPKFLDNWTIRIRIFWRFGCREQVILCMMLCHKQR